MADRYASLKQGLVGCWIPSISGSGLLLPDLSGRGNNGSFVGMDASDWVSSQYGRALEFDGVDDKVTSTHPLGVSVSQCTFSVWMRKASASDIAISSIGSETANSRFHISWFSDGQLYCTVENGASSYGEFTPSFTSNFRNYCLVYDGTQATNASRLRVFLDGQQVSLSYTGTIPSTAISSNVVAIGAGSGSFSKSQQDDVRIYNRALTESEIRLLSSEPGIGFKRISSSAFATRYTYKPPKPRNYSVIRNRDPNYSTLKHGLVAAYCPSISGQGNVLPDLVGRNHGTLTNMDASDWVASGDGKALDFDGVNDVVEANRIDLVSTGTLAAWVKLAGNGAIIVKQSTIANQWDYALYCATAASNTRLYFYGDGLSPTNFVISPSQLSSDWTHVVGMKTATQILLFVNGVQVASASATNNFQQRDFKVYLGYDFRDPTSRGVIQIDDARIYNRALTESEIKLLASKRGIGLEPRKPKITFADLGVQKTYSVVRVKETDYGNLRQGLVGAWCPSLPNGGSGNTLPDVSGYGNHGTLTNMSPDDWVSGQYGRALDFDGVNDYVVMSSPVSLSTLRGIYASAFVFPANTNTQKTIVKIGYTGTAGNQEFDGLTLSAWSDGNIYGAVRNTVIADADYVAAASYSANDWIHVALWVGIDATIRLYINGKQTGTTQSASTIADSPMTFTQAPTIGARYDENGTISKYFAGRIDDIRWGFTRADSIFQLLASRPGIGLRQDRDRNTFYQFPSGSRRKRILTGMP